MTALRFRHLFFIKRADQWVISSHPSTQCVCISSVVCVIRNTVRAPGEEHAVLSPVLPVVVLDGLLMPGPGPGVGFSPAGWELSPEAWEWDLSWAPAGNQTHPDASESTRSWKYNTTASSSETTTTSTIVWRPDTFPGQCVTQEKGKDIDKASSTLNRSCPFQYSALKAVTSKAMTTLVDC